MCFIFNIFALFFINVALFHINKQNKIRYALDLFCVLLCYQFPGLPDPDSGLADDDLGLIMATDFQLWILTLFVSFLKKHFRLYLRHNCHFLLYTDLPRTVCGWFDTTTFCVFFISLICIFCCVQGRGNLEFIVFEYIRHFQRNFKRRSMAVNLRCDDSIWARARSNLHVIAHIL